MCCANTQRPPQLEYDTERAGDLEPLKYLPLNKVVILGLVTTKKGEVRV